MLAEYTQHSVNYPDDIQTACCMKSSVEVWQIIRDFPADEGYVIVIYAHSKPPVTANSHNSSLIGLIRISHQLSALNPVSSVLSVIIHLYYIVPVPHRYAFWPQQPICI